MINNYELLKERINTIKNALPTFNMVDQTTLEKNNNILKSLIKEIEYYKNVTKKSFENKVKESFIPLDIINKDYLDKDKYMCNLILNDIYEQLSINEYLYNIKNPETLEVVNNNITKLVQLFNKVGITLTKDNFKYDINVYKYMELYFQNVDQVTLKNKFDELYWKNHNLLQDLEICFRNLIDKNIKLFIKYSNDTLTNMLKENNINKEQTINKYFDDLISYENKYYTSKGIIYDMFLNDTLNIDSYINIESALTKFIDKDKFNSLDENLKNEVYSNIIELSNNLYEYQEFTKYNNVLKKVNEILTKKESFKNTLATKLKTIDKLLKEKEKIDKIVDSLTVSLDKVRSKGKEKDIIKLQGKLDIKLDEQAKKNNSLREEYNSLDNTKYEDKYSTYLTENTTIYEAYLELLNYSYILKEYVGEDIEDFNKFIYNPYNKLIYTQSITSKERINTIIENKYKLLNYDIEINDSTVSDLYNASTIIKNYVYFKKADIDFNTIKVLCENKDLLEIQKKD